MNQYKNEFIGLIIHTYATRGMCLGGNNLGEGFQEKNSLRGSPIREICEWAISEIFIFLSYFRILRWTPDHLHQNMVSVNIFRTHWVKHK